MKNNAGTLLLLCIIVDAVLAMPCLCVQGVMIALVMYAMLGGMGLRLGYLYWRKRLSVHDVLIYEGFFILLRAIAWGMH